MLSHIGTYNIHYRRKVWIQTKLQFFENSLEIVAERVI